MDNKKEESDLLLKRLVVEAVADAFKVAAGQAQPGNAHPHVSEVCVRVCVCATPFLEPFGAQSAAGCARPAGHRVPTRCPQHTVRASLGERRETARPRGRAGA